MHHEWLVWTVTTDIKIHAAGEGRQAALIPQLTVCQGAKQVSRASKTIKHKTKCKTCRWNLGPQKTRRSEVLEAWSEESRKGPLAGFLLKKQFPGTAWEPPTWLIRERGIKAQLLCARISSGPRRSLILQKLWLVLLEGGWQRDSHARHQ